MEKKLVNCCKHALNIVKKNGTMLVIEPSGFFARCDQTEKVVDEVNGVEVTRQFFGEVVDLPEPQEDTIYIVSRLVADAVKRDDLMIPGPLMRNEEGIVIGCKGLSII